MPVHFADFLLRGQLLRGQLLRGQEPRGQALRGQARGRLVALATALALAASANVPATVVAAAGSAANPGPSTAAPSDSAGSATYEALCPALPAPYASCASLRRTDVAAVVAPQPGTGPNGVVRPAIVPGGYAPADLQNAYGLPASGGHGRTVAIVDAYDNPNAAADLAVYRDQFGLPACTEASGCFRKVDQRGGTGYPAFNSGWAGEIVLDLDMVSAACPDCKILLVEADSAMSNDLGAGVDTAVAMGAAAVSNSYTSYEWSSETAQDQHYNHPGVIITASTGDRGYQDGVAYPAASPYVVAVGGTRLVRDSGARGWAETVWSNSLAQGTGSGCSSFEPKPYWQTDSACPRKTTSDISAVADPNTGVAVYDSHAGGWAIYGGTSASSPIVAAAAILTGNPAPGSYASRLIYARSANLWDVTAGANGICGSYLCQAVAGYDGPTGLGTPNGTRALAPDVIDLGAGARTTCALTSAGTISCWGFGGAGATSAPTGTYVALSTGDSHSCAIAASGALRCWGDNSFGQSSPPAGSYRSVSAGGNATCAISTGRALHCWGDASHGVTSPPAGTYVSVAVGLSHACAIDTDAGLRCWGDNSHGQAAAPGGSYIAVAAGRYFTCALTSSAAATCWGDNSHSQLSEASGRSLDLDAGANGACVVKLTGAVACWGDNGKGQSAAPAVVAARVASGDSHACAYLATTVKCWGGNADGQSVPLFATTSLPAAGIGSAYATDVTLATSVVPAPAFSVTAGALPGGFAISAAGHLTGTAAATGTYTFTVTASNGIAPKASQELTLIVADHPAPGAPTAVSAVASNGRAVVTWGAPEPNGGAAVTGYTVTSSPPSAGCAMTPSKTCTVAGLSNHTLYTFSVTATNADGTGPAATSSATPLTGATYFPVAPSRLVDSRAGTRLGLSASLVSGTPAQFVVVNRSADPLLNVPANAVAVTGNLTVTNQGSKGYLTLTPAKPVGTPSTSTLNFPTGDNRANALTIPLRDGKLWVTFVGSPGARADVVFDVTGYFVPNATGATFVSVSPNRLVDSRAGTRLGLAASLRSGTAAVFTVTNRDFGDATRNIPANATAVTGNLTVTRQSSKGYFSLTPAKPVGTPTTSMLNFPKGDNRANALTIPLGGGRLWVTFVGSPGATADVIFDVTGYFVANASGGSYVALTPSRLVDSRAGTRIGLGKSLDSGTPARFTVVNRSTDPSLKVPSGAIAVTGNLTVTNQSSNGYLALTPADPGGTPTTSTLNFPIGDNRANALTVPLSSTGTLWVTFIGTAGAHSDVVFDVTGYFAP